MDFACTLVDIYMKIIKLHLFYVYKASKLVACVAMVVL